jgi:hypothetical protein
MFRNLAKFATISANSWFSERRRKMDSVAGLRDAIQRIALDGPDTARPDSLAN